MRTHTLAGAGATALLLGAFAAGGMTVAGNRDVARQAATVAAKANKALAKNDAVHAVAFAESAVTLAPRDAAMRMLLGQSYLKAGRFVSAGEAFADVLTLAGDADAVVGKAALNLALSQIAQGQWDLARTTLSEHAARIAPRDRGLALALAGDPNGGVEVLMAAARAPESDARTRQNLALTLALAGRWSDARTVVSSDVTGEEANRRIMSWIEFARPKAASDQVASLLDVIAAREDAGQPVALALNAPLGGATVQTAEATPAPLVAFAEAAPVVELGQPVARVEIAQVVPPSLASPRVVFAERREVVQALPPAMFGPRRLIAVKGAFKSPLTTTVPAKGAWFVQLGAYDNAGVAKDAWQRASRRYVALAGHAPTGIAFKARSGAFYRLSVGGFARGDAVTLCRGIRARGGACFVRPGAGDQVAQWIKPAQVRTAARVRIVKPHGAGVQVAAR